MIKKSSNYHPVLLRWQFSNMIFCIPVNGKTVKFDKLTNKAKKIRKSVVASCSNYEMANIGKTRMVVRDGK